MKTLDDAWRWYVETKHQVTLMRRLAGLYWAELPWDGRLGKDDHFRELDPEQLEDDANFNLNQIESGGARPVLRIRVARPRPGSRSSRQQSRKRASATRCSSALSRTLSSRLVKEAFSESSNPTRVSMPI